GRLAQVLPRREALQAPQAVAVVSGPRIAAIVLAAGRSTRMGAENKLLADVGGKPMVRVVAEAALASGARAVLVVTGHQEDRVRAALAGRDPTVGAHPEFADGLRTSRNGRSA